MTDPAAARSLIHDAVLAPGFRRATFAGVARAANPAAWVRVVVRPVELRGGRFLQFAYYDARQSRTQNVPPADAAPRLDEVFAVGFSAVHLDTDTGETDIRVTKKGKVLVGRRAASAAAPPRRRTPPTTARRTCRSPRGARTTCSKRSAS